MTEIEKKALALVNEIAGLRGTSWPCVDRERDSRWEALCRAIEAHEADKQAFSDAVEGVLNDDGWGSFSREKLGDALSRFIIKKPDPLVDAVRTACEAQGLATTHTPAELTEHLRQALAARGLKIVEQDQ